MLCIEKGRMFSVEIIQEADAHMLNNEVERALEVIEKAFLKANTEEQVMIGQWYKEWGFLEESNEIFEQLIEQFPDEIELQSLLVDNYIELGKDDSALNILDEHTNIAPTDPNYLEVVLQQADLYQAQGLFEVSEQKLLEAKTHFPNEELLDFALGELLFSIGKYQGAIGYYEKLHEQYNEFANVSLVSRLAESYAALGEYEQSLEFYQNEEYDNEDDLFKYGFTAFQSGHNEKAIQAWKKLIEIAPDYHTVYTLLAEAYEQEKLLAEAYDIAIKGLKLDEFNKELYLQSAHLAQKLNHSKEAEEYVREAIVLDPDYQEAVLFLVSLLKDQERPEDIVDVLESIQEAGAADALYDWELARAYEQIESFKDALKHYNQAYNSLKEDSEFLKEYGFYLVEEGHIKNAIQILKRYLVLEPSDDETEAYVSRLSADSY